MKKTFQKTLIAAAAGVALMSAVGTASANSLLFPYFTTVSGAQSVLSISSNNTAGSAVSSGKETLHYVYNYGPSCIHYDGNGSLTANDLMQHSVASTAAGGFGNAVPSDASSPFYMPAVPQEEAYGFLTVTTKTSIGAAISGDMTIVDPSSGLTTSYAGLSNARETGTAANAANEGNFDYSNNRWNLSFYGKDIAATSWYGVVLGNMYPAIAGNRNWTAAVRVKNNGFVYNNDEVPLSGTASKVIKCAGSFLPTELMTSAQSAQLAGNGGLIHGSADLLDVGALDGAVQDTSTGLYLLKMQAVQAIGAPFAGKKFLHVEQAAAW